MTEMTLAEAIAEVKDRHAPDAASEDFDPPQGYEWVIFHAVASGDLIPRTEAEQAVALAYQRALDVALVVAGHHKRMASHGGPGYGIEERMAAAAQSVHDAILALAPAEPLAEVARLRAALDEAYALGFEASGEGYNGEFPTMNFRNITDWQAMRRSDLAALTTPEKGTE